MAQMLFNLSGVIEDEAKEIRQLLKDNDIITYETGTGFWGTGVAAIWLEKSEQSLLARELLHNYQKNRRASSRQAWQQRESNGWIARFVEQPLKTIVFVFLAGAVAYASIKPFLEMMGD